MFSLRDSERHSARTVRRNTNHSYTPCTTRDSVLSGITWLVLSRALERPLNHRSTTSIRGDMSTRTPGHQEASPDATPHRWSTSGPDDAFDRVNTRTRVHTCRLSGHSHEGPTTRITDGRASTALERLSGITSTSPARVAPSGFTHSTSISDIIRLASSRALERTVNHRSTTSIRGDTSTRDTRSTGVAVRSLHGQPSAQATGSRSRRHHRCPGTCAHTC